MTEQEAIKSMKNLNLVLSITDSERESVNMAIKALEKQISLKRIVERLEECYDKKHEGYMINRDLIDLGKKYGLEEAIDIVKEEGGLND